MNTLPTGRRGQVLALAMLGMALLIVWLGLGAPLADWYGARADRLEAERLRVGRMEALAAMLPRLAHQDTGALRTSAVRDSDALAAAELQQRLEHLGGEADAPIASIETLPVEVGTGIRRIRLRLTLNGASWPTLLKLLGAIETDGPALLIDDLDLRPAGTDQDTPALQAQFSVIALRPGAAAAPSDPAATP